MQRKLPDCIEYGKKISILGTKCKVYTLSLDELYGTPEAGSEEQIEVSLLLDKQILAKGYVKLTVGFQEFDEDGGASDGMEDSIAYEVDDVLVALQKVILQLEEELHNEQKLVNSLTHYIEQSTGN